MPQPWSGRRNFRAAPGSDRRLLDRGSSQRGLADAGLAADQHDGATSGRGAVEELGQRPELCLPLDEHEHIEPETERTWLGVIAQQRRAQNVEPDGAEVEGAAVEVREVEPVALACAHLVA